MNPCTKCGGLHILRWDQCWFYRCINCSNTIWCLRSTDEMPRTYGNTPLKLIKDTAINGRGSWRAIEWHRVRTT